MPNRLTPIEGSETESTLCCGYKACLKKLNQEYLDAKCVGCTEIDYAKEWEKLKRYIELDKLRTIAINCGDDIYASTIAVIQNEICFPGAPERIIYGCTDSTSLLYNPVANEPCVVNGVINGCCTEQTSLILGCTDSSSSNYNPLATYDDNSCIPCVYGCTDNSASNYDSGATCDDGSCISVIPVSSNCNWRIGDTGPAGGVIFYISPAVNNEITYLECSRYDVGVGKEWGCLGDVIGQTFPDILMGQANTDTILATCADADIAAKLCDSHSDVYNGIIYDDWFLPSKEEMETIYFNLYTQGIGQFSLGYYWTSTENTVTSWTNASTGGTISMLPTGANPADYAWGIDFFTANSNFVNAAPIMKSISILNVRAVRKFTCSTIGATPLATTGTLTTIPGGLGTTPRTPQSPPIYITP